MNKKIVAIIPARSGSKGIIDKNIREIDGKPLIAYTIEAAKKSRVFTDILVSTDSNKYKQISEEYGAWVPFLRSEKLAQDDTPTNDVIEDVLIRLKNMGGNYDSFMILQPTSPLRDEEDIRNAVKLFEEKEANSVVSMCECEHCPLFTKSLDDEMNLDGFLSEMKKSRRQDLKKYYRLNGAIYMANSDYFLKYKSFYESKSYAFIMETQKSVDIDTSDDFNYAEFLIKKKG
ncbi:cytidylyltransferase domain-containing protein [Clostridium butyricum]|uniref:acylneuraminate cytidylyltransferase family protein n=1 Tax=Clostridium butyricum TaxID=1492 RepID=UPI0013D7A8C1|nr:acylneuraminate cytidylyltransferase family protein [Clostridium butyricum]MCQ2022244.1 acylneuraminate cytidylyltransferase family protein [Clostridium butyricum]NFB70110.1 acylneuraminate cytidylyltransferase family protein [Clostridium butyricum]NFB89897.1 acylneuraminate cytidylyltransferase family protein [Clostridium butyricum]